MYKNIIVPIDVFSSDLADKSLAHAQFITNISSGHIHLVNVIPPFLPELTRGFISDARLMQKHVIDTAKEKLSSIAKKLNIPDEFIHIHIRAGSVRDEVTVLADTLEKSIIIMGSRNPDVQTRLLGSSAAGIVRYANIPVLVIR